MSALFEAIGKKDFAGFVRLLKTENASLARDDHGGTVLHHLARRTDLSGVGAGIASLVSSKYDMRNWIVELRSSLLDLMLVQDSFRRTCMHVALENDNWAFALPVGGQIDYGRYPDRLRRNRMGLTEYELAIVLYGVFGRSDKLSAVFGEIDSIYIVGLGRGSPFQGSTNIHSSFPIFKRVAKAVKIVRSPRESGGVTTEYLSVDDPRFQHAIEDEYPSPYAQIEEHPEE
ncbi:MAG: hypothetical protein CVU22_14860 [Betaproteobacteria bacterium HGW-Betaproteobacteria-16]|nr:MAG: hypothetical protein CVU22_14860 [Betaproteobacteria bacterium HGW-Betaproteobacteria-16]